MYRVDRIERHYLTDIDTEAKTATCSVCGPGALIWRTGKRESGRWVEGRWRCARRVAAQDSRRAFEESHYAKTVKWFHRGIRDFTYADFEALLVEQAGRCVLCNVELMFPQVDHDHVTGKVRGILCTTCNTGLGKFEDDSARLRAAAEYIDRSNA